MAQITRQIGLSLGADICWPICYQELMKQLPPLKIGGDEVRFDVERVRIAPFDLRQDCKYDLVIDRLTHWYYPSREWIKKAVLMDDLYVFNNPWSLQSMEKQTSYCAMMRLGMPIPDTHLVPPKEYEHSEDLGVTLERYAELFDIGAVGEKLGYPMFMKPYDGGGWRGVSRIADEATLRDAYEQSGKFVMHLQKSAEPFDRFVRCVGLGPQVRFVSYDPDAPHHDRYTMQSDFLDDGDRRHLENVTLTINSFFGWDFNSCEALRSNGVWVPIDFANPCPDSQVTSLHYHFPWLLQANVRWSVFCAATKRPMRKNLDWSEFFAAHDPEMNVVEQAERYASIARRRMDAERFDEFCEEHLSELPALVHEFFGSETAKDAVRQKVAALFPGNEIEEFTELFFDRIQTWRGEQSAQAEGQA